MSGGCPQGCHVAEEIIVGGINMFQIGDVVTIRRDLNEHSVFNEVYVNRQMLKHRGRTYKITDVGDFYGEPIYCLDLGNGEYWTWREVMFEAPLIAPDELLALLEEV